MKTLYSTDRTEVSVREAVEGFRLTEPLGREHLAECCLPDKKPVYRTRSGREAARSVYYSSEHTFLL